MTLSWVFVSLLLVFPIIAFSFDSAGPAFFSYLVIIISGLMTTSGLSPFLSIAESIEFLSFSMIGASPVF
jgi:hypothetical protein